MQTTVESVEVELTVFDPAGNLASRSFTIETYVPDAYALEVLTDSPLSYWRLGADGAANFGFGGPRAPIPGVLVQGDFTMEMWGESMGSPWNLLFGSAAGGAARIEGVNDTGALEAILEGSFGQVFLQAFGFNDSSPTHLVLTREGSTIYDHALPAARVLAHYAEAEG